MNTKLTPPNKLTGCTMRGGVYFTQEEMAQYPESSYWRSGAEWAKAELYNTYDGCRVDERINKILSKFYNEDNTWMRICLRTEHMLNLVKSLREENNAT